MCVVVNNNKCDFDNDLVTMMIIMIIVFKFMFMQRIN